MSRQFFLIVTLSLFSVGALSQQAVRADTPLTRATVQALRNQVQLIFKNRVTRAARNADTMTPGDSLATARQSFAELRFNDSSLARIGERALFQFVPNTRNFYLGNGTALLLIPPGQGRTNVRTPNAAAGIRGSALFVRYNEDTNTTIVGALTNSRIEVSNGDNPQAQTLKAGQMAVIIQNQIVQVYNFDLNTFYQTSELVKDLDLPLINSTPSADPGIAAVQAETSQAAREQAPLKGQVSENPAFVTLAPPPGVQAAVTPNPLNTATTTPSGFDRGTAKQTILPNTLQPSSPDASTTPGLPTLLNPGNTTAPPPVLTTPPAVIITVPSSGTATPPAIIPTPIPSPPVVSPAPQPSTGTVTPAPITPAPVTPAPVTPAPTSGITAPIQPAITVTPAPAPTISPSITAPVQPTITVTPAPTISPSITAPVQPTISVTPAPAPAPTISPSVVAPVTPAPVTIAPVTPAPVTPAPTLGVTTPAPRPAPVTPTVLTPAPTSSVQVTTTNAAGTSGLQTTTTVTTPIIVAPTVTVPVP